MPKFVKMEQSEVDQLMAKKTPKAPGARAAVRQQYRDYLKTYKPGDWVSVEIEEGENRITVKNRLIAAAKESGLKLSFLRSRGPIKFQIVS